LPPPFIDYGQRRESGQKTSVLVFAPERVGLAAPVNRIEERNYNISFEPLSTERRFDEYDGIVVFQRTFEDLYAASPTLRNRGI